MLKNEEDSSLLNVFTKNKIYNLINLHVLYSYLLPDRRH